MKPRVLQLFASGVNCDRELRWAFEQAGARVREMHVR
jgi:phosphoribosylformylglycinamidine (FGAM) synthase-like amidotransferase family enzyme